MKNLRILPILCLMFLLLSGFSAQAQQYMSSSDAILTVDKVITQLEVRYGQTDRNSVKPFAPVQDVVWTEESPVDMAKLKLGNLLVKQLKTGHGVAESIQLALEALPRNRRYDRVEYAKAEEFYKQILSI